MRPQLPATAPAAAWSDRTGSSPSRAAEPCCGDCRPAGSVVPSPEALDLLGALLTGDWAGADATAPRVRREGSGLVAAYLQWHLERGIRSLKLVERSS
ncbi:DNA repair protein RecO C-terminal domain-containing protein [Yinghuangia aomiensis]